MKREEEQMARVDTMSEPSDSPTAGQNKPTHTPGPWCIKGPTSSGDMGLDIGTEPGKPWGYYTATVWGGMPDRVMEANARLIAAAPDLLAAVKELLAAANESVISDDDVASMLRYGSAVIACHAAIAKAEGRE